jgi:RNA polymerase sigma-70 factor (ECF subfamily)
VVPSDIVERFRDGDDEAIGAVYREYGGAVFAVAMRVLGDRTLAEESTQQTFVRAWRASRSFDASRELGPWLVTIARRVAIDVYRREARRPTTPLSSVAPDAPALVTLPPSAERAYEVWEVRRAVDALPADEREVVRLQHLDGFTQTEVAEQLGVPLGTVKSRSHRAHRRLAAVLGHLRDAPEDAS